MIVLQKISLVVGPWLFSIMSAAQSVLHPFSPLNVTSARFGSAILNPLVVAMYPAAAPYIKEFDAAVYCEKKYMTDINTLALTAALSFDNSGAGVLFQQFGTTDYSERTIGLVYGKRLGKVSIGLGIQHISINVRGGSNAGLLQSVASTILSIAENVKASVRVVNPQKFIITKKDNLSLATSYSLGLGWQASPVVYTGIETVKTENAPLAVILHLHYQFESHLFASLTWITSTNQPYLCAGWRIGKIRIEAGGAYHAMLGVSPSVAIHYSNKSIAGK